MSLVNGLGSVSEGDKQMAAAGKLCQPSFLSFRLAADWDQATPLFERAALNYKVRLRPESPAPFEATGEPIRQSANSNPALEEAGAVTAARAYPLSRMAECHLSCGGLLHLALNTHAGRSVPPILVRGVRLPAECALNPKSYPRARSKRRPWRRRSRRTRRQRRGRSASTPPGTRPSTWSRRAGVQTLGF